MKQMNIRIKQEKGKNILIGNTFTLYINDKLILKETGRCNILDKIDEISKNIFIYNEEDKK